MKSLANLKTRLRLLCSSDVACSLTCVVAPAPQPPPPHACACFVRPFLAGCGPVLRWLYFPLLSVNIQFWVDRSKSLIKQIAALFVFWPDIEELTFDWIGSQFLCLSLWLSCKLVWSHMASERQELERGLQIFSAFEPEAQFFLNSLIMGYWGIASKRWASLCHTVQSVSCF